MPSALLRKQSLHVERPLPWAFGAFRMTTTVTDRILLKTIHEEYYSEFCAFDPESKTRTSKIYVPIDCVAIARKLNVDVDIVFGRHHYHLEKKYGYTNEDGSKVHLFALQAGSDKHAVNFPLLSAVVAELEQSYVRFTLPLVLSLLATAISVISLAV